MSTENPLGLLLGFPCVFSGGGLSVSEFMSNQSLFLIYQYVITQMYPSPREWTLPPPEWPQGHRHTGARQQGKGGEQALVSLPGDSQPPTNEPAPSLAASPKSPPALNSGLWRGLWRLCPKTPAQTDCQPVQLSDPWRKQPLH